MLNCKDVPKYTLPFILIIGLMFQLKKSDFNISLNSSVWFGILLSLQSQKKTAKYRAQGLPEPTAQVLPLPQECHSIFTLIMNGNADPEGDDKPAQTLWPLSILFLANLDYDLGNRIPCISLSPHPSVPAYDLQCSLYYRRWRSQRSLVLYSELIQEREGPIIGSSGPTCG